ncbi:hypothetical protein CspeluHIS016_0206670 [Cutaneotrichosporon spelunceum]|uniref:Phosphodiesterase n=1 Tax=Cutaneotrichosporon spelunceum TaxID=1672016 RepID=A0AAD3YA58_9TREE|nr:hypothetical protein CspeluHIS016_0206670 [Cutaneotrichosporon spelunceum]
MVLEFVDSHFRAALHQKLRDHSRIATSPDVCTWSIMASSHTVPGTRTAAPLAVLVLFPDALSPSSPNRNKAALSLAPGNLTNAAPRSSGLGPSWTTSTDANDETDDPLIIQSRRLSLAPHLETRQSKSTSLSGLSPLSPFGDKARRSGLGPKSPIPDHLGSPALSKPRASVAFPSGQGLPNLGRRRTQNDGDALVDLFRASGVEVAVVTRLTHLPNVLGNRKSPSTSLSIPGATSNVQQVVLVPLGDAPPLPSLSLFLAQGTTPSAVCFQQDMIERARKTEENFLNHALDRIQKVKDVIHEQIEPDDDQPIILGYLSHGSLGQASISECLEAGAAGVLHPPYDGRTVVSLKMLVAAANDGTSSTVALASSPASSALQFSPVIEDLDAKVVLTPTALSMGAELESEKVLAASFTSQRRRRSTQVSHLSLNRVMSGSSAGSVGLSALSSEITQEITQDSRQSSSESSDATNLLGTPKTPVTTFNDYSFPTHINRLLGTLDAASEAARRRSVDTGGLALAFDRASKRMETMDGAGEPADDASDHINVVAGDHEQDVADGNSSTQFAEVLGDMYNQTMMSIDVQMLDYDEFTVPLSRQDHVRLVDILDSWGFRPHLLDEIDLFRVACLIFQSILSMDGVVQLGLDFDAMKKWLFAVRAIYHAPNPYHNYIHAIDVLQATYQFLTRINVAPPFAWLRDLEPGTTPPWKRPSEAEKPSKGRGTAGARKILRPQDVLAVVIAAMGHDVGHPGLSNAFMKNAKVPLSVVYDDKSVLENMHCMLSVQLLRKHGFGYLLATPTAAQVAEYPARANLDTRDFRRVLYSAILATDMSLHFAWIHRLKELGEGLRGNEPLDREEVVEEDRIMICQAMIKCADISNPSRPMDISEHWSAVLLDEWGKQASLEEELELPVSVVAGVDARLQAKGQIGFIDLFTQPLFRAAADVLPELETLAESVVANRAVWKKRLEMLEVDEDANELRTMVLRSAINAPIPIAEDDRYCTLFPLILPQKLVTQTTGGSSPQASPPASPATVARGPPSPVAHVQAFRAVYRHEIRDRSLLGRHLVALTGFDPASHGRRMSNPDVLLVRTTL